MPWCDQCDVYLAPNTLNPDGTCPTCEQAVDTADSATKATERPPWHFWMMVAALVAYLGWRLVQGVVWAAQHI
jgi:hypothetical protein